MSLPVINVTPHYETTVPSTGQKIEFRPFLVKEQKILLLALESRDPKQIIRAMNDILKSCMPDLDIRSLATFDLDYLFLQLRGKSAGEKIESQVECPKCKEPNDIEVNIEDVKMDAKTNLGRKDIVLNDKYTLTMKYPSYDYVMQSSEDVNSETEMLYTLVMGALDKLKTEDEIIDMTEEPKEELEDFMNSLSTAQFDNIAEYIKNIPTLKHKIEYDCKKCEQHNEINLEGLNDFFL